MKKLLVIMFALTVSNFSFSDPWSAMPSYFQFKSTSPYGSGVEFRNASQTFAFGVASKLKEKQLLVQAEKYNAESFLTNGVGTFAAVAADNKANQFGAYVFNEGSSYVFMGLVRHRFVLGSGYDLHEKSIFPKAEISLTPRFFNLGAELSYRYDRVNGQNENMLEIGFLYLW